MKIIRQLLHPKLIETHDRTYFQRAPDTATFPYLTYSLELATDGEGFVLAVLNVDGWDKPPTGSTAAIETLMQTVKDSLDKITLTNEDIVVSLYLDRTLALDDDDRLIVRRRQVYQGRLFERRE